MEQEEVNHAKLLSHLSDLISTVNIFLYYHCVKSMTTMSSADMANVSVATEIHQ